MKPSSRSPSYVIRNPYSYCFRLNVPADLQRYVGKTELRYSLRTGFLGVAKEKARVLYGDILLLFRSLRKGFATMKHLDGDRIKELVQQYLQAYKDGLETRYLDGQDPFMGKEDFEQYVNDLDSIRNDKITELGVGDYRWVESAVSAILKEQGLEGVLKESPEYLKLCRGILRSQIKGIEYEKRFMLEQELPGEVAPAKQPAPLPIPSHSIPVPPPEVASVTLNQLIEKFWNESIRSRRWSPGTIKEYTYGYKVLCEFLVSETPVSKIGYKELRDFKDMLMKLPPQL